MMINRWSCLFFVGLLFVTRSASTACDYTVRDIGFVELNGPRYSLVVIGPQPYDAKSEIRTRLKRWGIGLLSVTPNLAKDLPDGITQRLTELSRSTWSMWLIDDRRRVLEISVADSADRLMTLDDFIDHQLNTPTMRKLIDGSVNHFAQIILLRSDEKKSREVADQAAGSLRDLEAMLPRPIRLPARVIEIDSGNFKRETLLHWAIGGDDVAIDGPAAAVLYGRGRMAGRLLRGEQFTLPHLIAQLALVGESCECETQRDWLSEKTIPFRWTDEENRQAAAMLGFNPSLESVQIDVRQVIERGKRGNAGSTGDQIDRIVSGYLESAADGSQPELIAIPPGRTQRKPKVRSEVIQGQGWGFSNSVEP